MKLNLHRVRFAAAACVLTLAVAMTAHAYGLWTLLPGDTIPFVKPYSANQASWWKWALGQPAATSPLLDTTGASCAQGQSKAFGSAWFLAGTIDGSAVTRSCTIPADRFVVFPILNEAYFAFPTDPANERTDAYVRAQNVATPQAKNLSVTIDGVTLPSFLLPPLTQSTIFSVTLPKGNIFGPDLDGTVLSPSADQGYYVSVKLLPGSHKISWKGTMPGGAQNATYNITVQ